MAADPEDRGEYGDRHQDDAGDGVGTPVGGAFFGGNLWAVLVMGHCGGLHGFRRVAV